MAAAPAFGGSFALVEAGRAPMPCTARPLLAESRQWILATTRPRPRPGRFAVAYRVPLWVSVQESALLQVEIDGVLGEVNTIWAQAGICFQMRQTATDEAASGQLLLRFIGGGDDLPLMGMYDGNLDMWVRDRPALEPSPHATLLPASRTASHELGHALSLVHYDGREDSIDSLMASGRRGFRLHSFEVVRAREAARVLGERGSCSAAHVWQRQ